MAPSRKQRNDSHGGGGRGGPAAKGDAGAQAPVRPGCPMPLPNQCLTPDIPLEENGREELVKVICNNPVCNQGSFMHKACFESWQELTMNYLRNCGRARSWSERQRHQNIWSKKGYDLVLSVCGCNCGRGHLRKDLDYVPPRRPADPIPIPGPDGQQQPGNAGGAAVAAVGAHAQPVAAPKKKKGKNREQRPTLAISAPVPHPNNNQHHVMPNRDRGSIDSNSSSGSGNSGASSSKAHAPIFGSCGSSSSGSFDLSSSPPGCSSSGSMGMGVGLGLLSRPRLDSVSSNISGSSNSSTDTPPSPSLSAQALFKMPNPTRKNSKDCPDRSRRDSGIFAKRLDYSAFNRLPNHKVNAYHIKIEDETHGNEEPRNFVLATCQSAGWNQISCILCHGKLTIFDRYPLIDGTFFISPRRQSECAIEFLHSDGRMQYLSAVCMGCLEGWYCKLTCRCCYRPWDGSDLMLGSCYTYDIFAATPCCEQRLSCSACQRMLMTPEQRPMFFSEYSRSFSCPFCGTADSHLAKFLPQIFIKINPITGN